MYSDDYEESHKLEMCNGCGRYFLKSELKKCKHCGEVLCPACQKRHICFTNPLTHTTQSYTVPMKEKEIRYREPKQRRVRSSSPSRISNYFFIGLIILVILSVGAVLVLCADGITDSFRPDPHIVLDKSQSGEMRTIISFDIGSGKTETVTVKADAQIYSGALSPKSREFNSADYLTMMTLDEAQNEFYDSIVTQFDNIKKKHGFTSDQFVEAVTSFVQTITYDNNAEDDPKYPVVTAIDKFGDCDETSMLLAGILSHAGYDVALLHFGDDKHMTAGIKTPNGEGSYAEGYAVIETTQEGWYVTETTLKSPATVYPIGKGTKTYDAAMEVSQIVSYFKILDDGWDSIENNVDEKLNKANDIYERYKQISEELEGINNQMAELNHQYSSTVMYYEDYESKWKALENRYYSLSQTKSELWEQYKALHDSYSVTLDSRNNWADIYNTLSNAKVCDRANMYQYILAHPLKI